MRLEGLRKHFLSDFFFPWCAERHLSCQLLRGSLYDPNSITFLIFSNIYIYFILNMENWRRTKIMEDFCIKSFILDEWRDKISSRSMGSGKSCQRLNFFNNHFIYHLKIKYKTVKSIIPKIKRGNLLLGKFICRISSK